MNCASARNRLLALAEAGSVPDPVAAHLTRCPACRSWHELLVRVDVGLCEGPVPVSDGRLKRELIAKFRTVAAPRPTRVAKPIKKSVVVPYVPRPPLGDRLARLWPAGLVAAAVLVGVLAWISNRGGKDEANMVAAPRDPMLEAVVRAKVELDIAESTQERLIVLGKLAATIHDEATSLSKVTVGKEMESLAKLYDQVVTQALVVAARDLSPDERKVVLRPIADRLSLAEQNANRLAAEAPKNSEQPLRDIAKAAGDGKISLTRMFQGGVS
jgi:hypothetical protein